MIKVGSYEVKMTIFFEFQLKYIQIHIEKNVGPKQIYNPEGKHGAP